MKKRTPLVALICALICLFAAAAAVSLAQQPSKNFPSVPTKSEAAKLPAERLSSIREKYQLQIECQLALKTARRLQLDASILDRFQKEYDLQTAQLNVLVLSAQLELGIPKEFVLDLQTGSFAAPPGAPEPSKDQGKK